jgi:hypothetical protein
MNRPRNIGMLLLAIYLVAIGAEGLIGIRLGALSPLVPLLALISGICLLLEK